MNHALAHNNESARERLEAWVAKGQLFALVDPFFEIPFPIEKMQMETRDTDPVFFEVIAWDQVTYEPPYLAKLTRESLDWILNSLSTERWGLFIVADVSLEILSKHFQKFIIARGPDTNPYFLRFHDASVLEVLLRTWEPKEKAIFFGPATAFGLPDLDTMDIRIDMNPFAKKTSLLPRPEDCLIQLRDTQLILCSEAIDRDLVKVIYWHLRNHHSRSVQFIDKSGLEARIQFAICRARAYNLGTISDLAGYTALMFELAPNFDEHPSFHRVLVDPGIPNEVRMKRLSQVITDREWDEAVRAYDRAYWPNVLKKPQVESSQLGAAAGSRNGRKRS